MALCCILAARRAYTTAMSENPKQNNGSSNGQAGHVTQVKRREQRSMPAHLGRLLELVNLVPRDFDMPEKLPIRSEVIPGLSIEDDMRERTIRAFDGMPDALRAHLLGFDHWYSVLSRYHDIRAWRENLRKMIAGEYPLVIEVRARIEPDQKHKAQVTLPSLNEEPFANAITGADVRLLKECPVCGKFFYAIRINQDAWPANCAVALRKRRERANAKLRSLRSKKRSVPKPGSKRGAIRNERLQER